jgi:beta-glucanase (GH16 family)
MYLDNFILDVLRLHKSRSIKTFFVLVATIFFAGHSHALNVSFGPFGDAVRDGDLYTWPTGAEPWAGYYSWTGSYDNPQDIPAMSFANGGTITFTAALASPGSTELRFKLEKLSYPDTEPSFYTSWVQINSTIEKSYTVNIPAQSPTNTYASFLLYLGDRDKSVILKNFEITGVLNGTDCGSSLENGVITIEAECYSQTLGDVDVENTTDIGGGQNVGWIDAFDAMIYDINVPTSGNYELSYRVSSPLGSDLGFNFSVDNQLVDTFTIPNTGGWQAWQTVIGRVVALDAGDYTFKLEALDSNMNFNWFALTQTNKSVDPAPVDNNDSGNWQPVDSTKWFHQTQLPNGWGWFNNEQQHYTDELSNSYVSNGTLKVVAKKENYYDQGHTKQYTSARLNSKFAFKYGKVEFRAKMPNGYGTWPAVWMLNRNINETGNYWGSLGYASTSWPACGEIDILEHWGRDPGYAQSAMHTTSSSGATINHGGRYINNIFSQFHTYSMDWNADRIIFKIDGIEHYRYNPWPKNNDTWPYDDHFYLILNVAIEESITSAFTQSQMEIDWIRVYHHQTNELLWSDEFETQALDSDNDGILDDEDAFPNNPYETTDTDNDGIGNNTDPDDDGDGLSDYEDAFPLDASESLDTDNDGIGNNTDLDDDGDGVPDYQDAFPLDSNETLDTDNDGIGNNSDNDDDGDGIPDVSDSEPLIANNYTDYQIVYVSNSPKGSFGKTVTFNIAYDVTSNDNQLTGLGMRLHFDSSKLELISVNNIITNDVVIDGTEVYSDTLDYDGSVETDKYVSTAWASLFGNWPNIELPASLFSISFLVKDNSNVFATDSTSINFSKSSNAQGYGFSATSYMMDILPASWDFDSNEIVDALTDGLLFLRYTFDISGHELTNGAIATDSSMSPEQVEDAIENAQSIADIDGDNKVDALTDGLLLLRYLFNVSGDDLINGAISDNAQRTTHSDISGYIINYMPEGD